MASAELKKLQTTSTWILNEHILDPEILRKRCPLDHGRHTLTPIHDLGTLSRLPIELQHHILGEADLASLFTFRRVNQSALVTVNGVIEYGKASCMPMNCLKTTDNFYRSWLRRQTVSGWHSLLRPRLPSALSNCLPSCARSTAMGRTAASSLLMSMSSHFHDGVSPLAGAVRALLVQ